MIRNLTISTIILVAILGLAAGCEPENNDINMTEDELQSEQYALDKSGGGFTPTDGGLDAILEDAGEDDSDGVTSEDDWETPVLCGLGSCPLGIIKGAWKRKGPKGGVFAGNWISKKGKTSGKLAGIWGVNKGGKRVFFGKFIGLDNEFKGMIKGTYTPAKATKPGIVEAGIFKGEWTDASGKPGGVLAGKYTVGPAGGKGQFNGGWKVADETESCVEECLEDGYMTLNGDMAEWVENPTQEECEEYCEDVVAEESNGGEQECGPDCMNACEPWNPGWIESEQLWDLYCSCLGSCGCGC